MQQKIRIAKGGTPLPSLQCEPKASTYRINTETWIFMRKSQTFHEGKRRELMILPFRQSFCIIVTSSRDFVSGYSRFARYRLSDGGKNEMSVIKQSKAIFVCHTQFILLSVKKSSKMCNYQESNNICFTFVECDICFDSYRQ